MVYSLMSGRESLFTIIVTQFSFMSGAIALILYVLSCVSERVHQMGSVISRHVECSTLDNIPEYLFCIFVFYLTHH